MRPCTASKTDGQGRTTFHDLPSGRHTLTLDSKNFPRGVKQVTAVATVNGKEAGRWSFDAPASGTRRFDVPIDVGPPPAGIKGSTAIVALLAVR